MYVGGKFQPGLLDDADSIHAEAARAMVLRHDWVTLYIDGMRYLERRPPLNPLVRFFDHAFFGFRGCWHRASRH